MTPKIETRPVPPRGLKGSNMAIIRSMEPAKYVLVDGRKVLQGDSYLCPNVAKANSFWSSARKIGLGMIRRTEENGTRVWVVEKNK